jgi:DDE_Tnp_1-associated
MVSQPRPLIEVVAKMPDCRSNRGQRHALAAILAVACSAMLCGSRSYIAIADWGRNYGARLMRALGFTLQPPGAATLHTVLRRVDREEGKPSRALPGRISSQPWRTAWAWPWPNRRVPTRRTQCRWRSTCDASESLRAGL